ncbi:BTAD domain-containing putative transcriptional regulator [Streptomyces sp. BRA346]|uniref:BTAD domain-containing putative transcriptional regulator n=1 Tax=Streptomyces sp. BRA346 TaxID=2878199 RepID=UPI004064460D
MRFRVLGPLTVLGRGGPVALGGIKQRAALGFLLLHANQVVATSTLLRALWTGNPPPTARKMLQNAISSLRGLLSAEDIEGEGGEGGIADRGGGGTGEGAAPAPMLLTHAPGYLLSVHTDALDLTAYQGTADRGRAELAAGSWIAAAKTLRTALEMWQGPVLADLAEAGADWPELTGIQQARLTVQEDLFEAELACGGHHEVVQELEALVVAEPVRERLCAELLLALYRCGRQVDALELYRRTRTAFADKLGLEPGRVLRDMERAILEHDPVLSQPDALGIIAQESEVKRGGPPAQLSRRTPPQPAPPPRLAPAGAGSAGRRTAPPRPARAETGTPPAIVGMARHVAARRSTPPAPSGGGLTEQRKQLSMLLVRTHPGGSPQGAPQDAAQPAGCLTATIREEIERHGGKVSGVIGPVTFALFGVPRTGEDDAARAVQAGLAIRDRLGCRGPGRPDPTGQAPAPARAETAVRVAVATGEVLVTCAADGTGAIPVVSGAVPESCMELLETVPPGGIRVCAATRRSSERTVEYEPVEEPGGGSEPVVVRPDHARAGGPPALMGREREVEQLRGLLDDVRRRRRPHFLTVLGEPGLGKSRLVAELVAMAGRGSGEFTVLTGRGSFPDRGAPLDPLRRIVAAAAGIEPSDSAASGDDKLARTVHRLFGTGETGTGMLARLRELLRSEGQDAVALTADGEVWRRLLAELAAERPLVVVFEDAHLADASVLDFIQYLGDTAGTVPMLVAVTARPELLDARPGWGGGLRDALTLTLDPLSAEGTAGLLAALLARDGYTLPRELRQELLTRIGGNPLFAVEYAHELRERPLPGSAVPPVPEYVHRVIASRVDTVPPDAKAVLVNASALGGVFSAESVAAVGDGDRAEAAKWLDCLERRDLLRRSRHGSPAGETQYAFRYPAIRDVVDSLVSPSMREEKLRRAVSWSGRTP